MELDSPAGPIVVVRRKRIKRVVDSESEAEGSGDDDSGLPSPVPVEPTEYERCALDFFNTSNLVELQELTGKRPRLTVAEQPRELCPRCRGITSLEDHRRSAFRTARGHQH